MTYNIAAEEECPLVKFDMGDGIFLLKGKSTMKEPSTFFNNVIEKLNTVNFSAISNIELILDFDFFNIASSKEILKIIYVFNKLHEKGNSVKVKWFFHKYDNHMEEIGRDFAYMVKVPFEFHEFSLDEQLT